MENEDEEWIESPTGWGTKEDGRENNDGGGLPDLFASDDPKEYFTYRIRVDGTTSKSVRLQGFKLDSEETYQSTGVTLWQAAPRLADYLQNHPEACRGKSVLELGAGLGLCGIAAHYSGAKIVVMTDGDTQTLRRLRENVRHNCVEVGSTTESNAIECRQLIWGSPHMEKFLLEHGQFDTVIGADVIYTQDSVQPLLDTVVCMLKKPHGQFVLSRFCKWNNVNDEFVIEAAYLRCLDCTRPSEGIYVFRWNDNRTAEK